MQLLWLASPLGKMHAVSITRARALVIAGACALAFIATGMVLYGIAIGAALQARPDLVCATGILPAACAGEQRDAENREKVARLQRELAAAEQQLLELETLKDSFMQMALPRGRTPAAGPAAPRMKGGMGGPERRLNGDRPYQPHDAAAQSAADYLDLAQEQFRRLNQSLTLLQSEWERQLVWIEHLPTGRPIEGGYPVASRFGARLDPFTRRPARHDGVDFTAPPGTSILAAASGVVVRVARDAQYGRMVDIDHGNGYLTRYAHTRAVHVREGEQVKRGQRIAEVGSTGRSTGPHLHYEVHREGPLDPQRYLPQVDP